MARRRALSGLIIALSLVLTLVVVEVLLRGIGRGPWEPFAALSDVPRLTQADDALGWTALPGAYTWSPTGPDGEPVRLTLEADGRRRGPRGGDGPRVTLYGGSFMLGFGVDDEEHVGARLAGLRPEMSIENHGVPGFGTLQSARLQARHQAANGAPDVVVYGLVDLHDARNAATRSWLHALERAGGHHPYLGVPSATWDGQTLQEHPPRRYTHWPASEVSAVVNLLELAWIDVRDRTLNTKSETTVQLVRRWQEQASPARFVVALLHAPRRERAYLRRLHELGVEVVDLRDCGFPEAAIPVDGHPDASVHACWADGLAGVLP